MARLLDTPIKKEDILEFADRSSDFGFELRVLSQLNDLGFECEHGGTYEDPVTKKNRQFDIRAWFKSSGRIVRMAIECKNLRESFPLAVFTVPRSEAESYHDIIQSREPENGINIHHSSPLHLCGNYSFYPPNDPVGKSCTQVGRTNAKDLTGNDTEVYDKWSQAIHSAHDLIYLATHDWQKYKDIDIRECHTFVLPILVVPNKRLWVIEYESGGSRTEDPRQADRASIYIDKFVKCPGRVRVRISHLEIVTKNGLINMCNEFCNNTLLKKAFPYEGIKSARSQT